VSSHNYERVLSADAARLFFAEVHDLPQLSTLHRRWHTGGGLGRHEKLR
jgi:hypothetical protein